MNHIARLAAFLAAWFAPFSVFSFQQGKAKGSRVVTETEIPSPKTDKVITALRKARQLWAKGRSRSAEFHRTLQSVIRDLPELKVGTNTTRIRWNLVVINQTGVGFDALRFRSPLKHVGNMYWVFVAPGRIGNWNIVPAQGTMRGFRRLWREHGFQAQGVDLPLKNQAVFQAMEGGRIEPGKEYIVWFASDPRKFSEVHMAIRLAQVESVKFAKSVESIAAAVGIRRRIAPGFLKHQWYRMDSRAVAASAKYFASCSKGATIHIDEHNPFRKGRSFKNPAGAVTELQFSADGKVLLAVSRLGKAVTLWDPDRGRLLATMNGRHHRLQAAAISPDGKTVAGFDGKGTDPLKREGDLVFWDAATGHERSRTPVSNVSIESLLFAPDGKTLIGGGGQVVSNRASNYLTKGRLLTWNVDSRRESSREPVRRWIDRMSLSADGERLVVNSGYDAVFLWDLKRNRLIRRIPVRTAATDVAWSHNGRLITITCVDGSCRLFDPVSQQYVDHDSTRGSSPLVFAYRPDGETAVALKRDGEFASFRFPKAETKLAAAQAIVAKRGKEIVNSLGMPLVPIPAGDFLMGSPKSDRYASGYERPQHRRRIAKPFSMSRDEVAVSEFRQFVTAVNYQTEAERAKLRYIWSKPEHKQYSRYPVVCVSWNDAVAFCRWLSKKEGREYRLPTEAEWEYACRAGTTTPWQVAPSDLWQVANICDRTRARYRTEFVNVAPWLDGYISVTNCESYLPNLFGLYDMHGSVAEWCSDWFDGEFYRYAKPNDTSGPRLGRARVVRGGSFRSQIIDCRSTTRRFCDPSASHSNLGFRVVRVMTPAEDAAFAESRKGGSK